MLPSSEVILSLLRGENPLAPASRPSDDNRALYLVIWLGPLALAVAHDPWSRGRVHRTYVIGAGILLVAFSRVFAMVSGWFCSSSHTW